MSRGVSDLTSARWDDDDALLTELRAALDVPAVPEHVVAAAKAAYTWRTIDEELAFAVLVYDSSLDDSALVRGKVRGLCCSRAISCRWRSR